MQSWPTTLTGALAVIGLMQSTGCRTGSTRWSSPRPSRCSTDATYQVVRRTGCTNISARPAATSRSRGYASASPLIARHCPCPHAPKHRRSRRSGAAGDGRGDPIGDGDPGISPQDRTRIFDRLVLFDASRSKAGHGPGLSMVDSVALAHGCTFSIVPSTKGMALEVRLAAEEI